MSKLMYYRFRTTNAFNEEGEVQAAGKNEAEARENAREIVEGELVGELLEERENP